MANLMMLLAAAIWGMGFVAQSLGMTHLSPFAFSGLRFLLGALSLLPLLWWLSQRGKINYSDRKIVKQAALICGGVLFFAASLQQVGLQFTTAANAGFLTGFYIVLVPIIGMTIGHRTGWTTWVGGFIALTGLYFLSVQQGFTIGYGDTLQIIGALFWAIHILAIDHYARKVSPILLAALQFIVCGLLSLGVSALFETTTLNAIALSWAPIAYAGLISVGVAYTLQVLAQQKVQPAHAALILSLEAAFAAIGGIMFLDESLSVRSLIGCGLMLAGIVLSQLNLAWPAKGRRLKANTQESSS